MSFFGELAGAFFGDKAEKAVDETWEDVKGKVEDVGNWVDKNIIQPIKDDPLRFIVIAAAYAYGIPGLEFAGAGSAAATGIASGAYSLASGKSLEDSLKDGVITAAGTAATNFVKAEYFGGTPATSGGTPVDASGAPALDASAPTDVNVDAGGGSGLEITPVETSAPISSPLDPVSLDPTQAQNTVSGAPKLQPSGLEMPSLQDTRFPTEQVPVNNPVQPGGPQMNAGQTGNSVYRSSVSDLVPDASVTPNVRAPIYEAGYGEPSVKTLTDPTRNMLPVEGTGYGSNGAPVYDLSTTGTPLDATSGTPTAGQAWDYTKALGENAVNFAIDHPYYTIGGLALANAYLGDKDKPKDGGGSDPNKQIGDPRFYQPLEQLQMVQNYDPYKDDIYTYGQTGGEHQFLTSPVYVPVQYADGGQVGVPPVDPMQQQYASPAVGPMMAPQQMAPQQPMGALSQPNVMGYKPSPLTPRTGRPPVPQQMQGRGAPQQVPPQQQNPNYRYFSYGQIPESVSMPMQQPQGRATGGLAMAHGGNVPDGRTDDIPALLSQGEYVMDAETVALLGNGNNDAGAKRLDHMREAIRKQKGGALAKGKISPDAQSPLAYLSRSMA